MALSSIGGSIASLSNSRSSKSGNSGETSSPFSSFLRSAAGSQEDAARTTAADGTPAAGKTDELKLQADKALADFKQSVSKLLSDAGIDTTHKIRLESDGQGGVHVAGDHPDRDKIEDLLRSNPELAQQFQQLAEQFQKLRAAEPAAAATPQILSQKFGLSLCDGEAEVEFA